MDVINTLYSNNVDFYLSFSLGLTLAITTVSIGKIFTPMFNAWRHRKGHAISLAAKLTGERRSSTWKRLFINDPRRGDFSIWIALGIYIFSNTFWIGLSCWLIEGFPWHFFVFYALA